MSRTSWVEPTYSKAQIDRAGRTLVSFVASDEEADPNIDVVHALEVFSNWRAAHGYPLNTNQVVLRHRARRVASTALVSQRHKREFSIVRKLERSQSMRLSQMQDIAGCRVILSTIKQVKQLYIYYQADVRNDYIASPASSGYRSIHAVSRYQGKTKTAFDGLFVETQIRTALQHAWATAVETVDTFTGSDLKSGFGEASWRRLFALVGSGFALREGCATVPKTPAHIDDIVKELRDLESELGLSQRLTAWHRASQVVRDPSFRFKKYLLIEQRPSSGIVKLHTYGAGQFEEASRRYSELEQEVTPQNRLQIVMASADSLPALKRAYPNLFVDPTEFLKAYQRLLDLPK